jgi:MFS family permease
MTSASIRKSAPASSGRRTARLTTLSPLLRLLVLTQLAFNIGFFAVLPFLAEHLGQSVGMAGWLVGFVLGLRTFSQQGLFVVGGALADRYGIRPVVLTGCVLRIAGFAWLGFAERTWAVVGAVLLIGFAAALFSPAVESEVARQAVVWEESVGGDRTRVLALFTVAGQAGAFVGPLLGALLLAVDFRTACLAGAGVFVLVLAGHARLLPQRIPGRVQVRVGGGARLVLRNRRFLALCCAYGAYLLAYNQLYLALPAEVERAAGSQAPLAWLFALSSLLVVTAQLSVTRWAGERLAPRADRRRVRGRRAGAARRVDGDGRAGTRRRVRRPAHARADAGGPRRPCLGPGPRRGGAARAVHGGAVLGLRARRARRQFRDRPAAGHRLAGRRAVAGAGRGAAGGGGGAAPAGALRRGRAAQGPRSGLGPVRCAGRRAVPRAARHPTGPRSCGAASGC